jgi:peroxiredoxin
VKRRQLSKAAARPYNFLPMKKLFVAALALCLAPQLAFAEEELAAVDQPAPMFRLPVYNGKAVGATFLGLDRYTGDAPQDKDAKLVLISFMASFCAPCKKEMPYLQQLHERYKDFGLRVVMVSIDTEPEGQKIIDELIAKNNVTFPVLKDRFNLVARRWLGSKSPLPSVFFIRPDGTIAKTHRGYSEEVTSQLLAEVETGLGIKRAAEAKPKVARP